ncbi:EscV/YscV/HrcV family type III secretion system export apparatus protein [Paludibacterium paludis]|uniref:Invasion protein InvA n=1 Tax=Paludibacterium paludis TaxID=1225769 RepID=A0A918UBL6_9NEIS|nr:EscV/YscV/HrcV family type III secretion system export apparatus protein [Paludibacterium paludis]GGY24015.1 invasion protein InvA [Paludibacterium paludis]
MNRFLQHIKSRPELLILLLVVTIIAMLIIPLPTFLVDFLIGLNITIALLVFMGSFYIERILGFSTFPSVLLITTLFRLALSISTSRLILIEANAGEIISSFGQFVIGDNLAVGFVIFAIVTVVQFIVITKGSERVAEVAARFSLDGMPGKQMSIDADLKAGTIDADGARERRKTLEQESQLYGSFDGAMKFIKGDAIAGIIVIFVNFIGGISIGMVQHGMDMSTALSTYTILTIGDGLVAQIPALLIAISAGFIVTRVNGEEKNLGQSIMGQLLGNSFTLLVTAILALSIGFLPGFPLPVFVILSALLGGLYLHRLRASRKTEGSGAASADQAAADPLNDDGGRIITDLDSLSAQTVPLMLVLHDSRRAEAESLRLAERLRSQYFLDYGVRLPEIVLRYTASTTTNRCVVLINEVRADELPVHFGMSRVINANDEIAHLGLEYVQDIQSMESAPAFWFRAGDKERLQAMGYALRSAEDELYMCFANLLSRSVTEFFGVQETKNMIDQLEKGYPDLVKEAYRHATVQRIAEVLQRLLMEKISIRNMKLILEALAQWAPREKDVIALVEQVRGSLGRYICQKFANGGQLAALMVSAGLEERIRRGVRQTATGTFLNLEPAETDDILDTVAAGLSDLPMSQKDLVLLASVDVRRFLKKLIESRFRDLEVLSFGEITDTVSVNVIKTL